MKDLFEQIKYLDATFLPIFGIDSIVDYVTEISVNDLKEDDGFLEKVNQEVSNLREYFPARDFSFHKTDNQIKTEKQAFSYLLKCLNTAKIPHDLTNRRNVMYVRLISENIVLKQYIEKFKMFGQISEIRNSDSENQNTVNGPWLNPVSISEPSKSFPFIDPAGFVLGKQVRFPPQAYELKYDEFQKGVIDRDEVITFRVPLTSFFAKDRQIMSRHMRQNLKNVVINAEILGTDDDQREATNALINGMIQDISYNVSFMKMECFKSKFEFGKPLFPENMYIPYKYQDYAEMSIHIDLPTDFELKFNNSLVLSVDVSVFDLRAKMRNMMIDGNYSLVIPFTTFDGGENGLKCQSRMIGVMYHKDDVKNETWEIPQDVEFEDYYLTIDEKTVKCKEITKVSENQESSQTAIMCLVSSDYQNVCAPLRNRYSIDAYRVEGDAIVFDIFINRCSDTFHDLKVRFPNDSIQNPKFTLVYQSKYGEDLEYHSLDYELETEIENNTEHAVFAIKRYNREYMLHNYCQLCLVLRIEINKQEVPTVINYLDLITVENYWCTPMRRELFEYTRTYDFMETLKEPKTIRVWKQLMKSKRAHWKMADDFKQVAYNSRMEKKQERIAKKEKSKGGNRGRPNRPATKAKGGRGGRGNRGGRRGKVKRAQRSDST